VCPYLHHHYDCDFIDYYRHCYFRCTATSKHRLAIFQCHFDLFFNDCWQLGGSPNFLSQRMQQPLSVLFLCVSSCRFCLSTHDLLRRWRVLLQYVILFFPLSPLARSICFSQRLPLFLGATTCDSSLGAFNATIINTRADIVNNFTYPDTASHIVYIPLW
jgi:hypothetical protein